MNSEQNIADYSAIRVEKALSKAQGLVRFLLNQLHDVNRSRARAHQNSFHGSTIMKDLEEVLDQARTEYHHVLNEHREECRQIQKYQRVKVARLIR